MIDANRRTQFFKFAKTQRLNYQKRYTSTELIERIIRKKVIREKKETYKTLKEMYESRYFKRKISSISLLREIFVSNELRHGADIFYHILQS